MLKFTRTFDPGRLKLLIFDLDGTLVDSRLDLVHSVNAMLQHFHRPELPEDAIASYVGDGAPMLVRRALGDPDNEQFVQEALEYFLSYYRVHKLDNTHLYPGVREALEAIRDQDGTDRRMAVLSNKPVNPSRAIVDALGLGEFFVRVYGGNSFSTKKPDPLGVYTLLEETGTRSDETIMIGDSSIDVITGRNADLWTCGVTYGFAPRTLDDAPPDVLVDSPSDLAQLFTQVPTIT
ncbi:MAG TPA: HAD-IA family hydrolase [Terriglobales bacterium]|nr:HAD-IA family hydrolase [Terriglobales bacterium]